MSKLDTQSYVLTEQRELPEAERIYWTYHIPTFGDFLAASLASRKTEDPMLARSITNLMATAGALESSRGVQRNGQPDEFPAEGDLDARVMWLMRLPPHWVGELIRIVGEESDLDQEEE